MRKRFVVLSALISLLLPGVLAVQAQSPAGGKGDLWETTSQMSMEGMPMQMPKQTNQVCAAREWTAPPTATNPQQECQNSDFKTSGNTSTWKVTCQSPPMTGVGEITRSSADAYTGSIKFSSAEGGMTIKLSGRRLGECDAPVN